MGELDETKTFSAVTIPSRERHNLVIRRLWWWCAAGAALVFAATSAVALALYFKGHDSDKILKVSTTIFQILIMSYGIGFFVPAFTTSLLKMSLGVEMSREGLEVGKRTAKHIDHLQKELRGILTDVREIVGPVRSLIEDLKRQKVGKVVEFIERLSNDGSIEKIAGAVESIGDRIHKAIEKVEKGAVDKMVDKL